MPTEESVENKANKFDKYYEKLIDYAHQTVDRPNIVGLKYFKELEIYQVINEAHDIFNKYRDGEINFDLMESDMAILNSLAFTIAEYAGMLKGGAKNNSNIRKAHIAENAIAIKTYHETQDSGKLTDKTIEWLSLVAGKDLNEELTEYESLASIFENVLYLINSFTAILNSIKKREHEANIQYKQTGSH